MTKKTHRLNECVIQVMYGNGSIHLINDIMLWKWMSTDTVLRSRKLVKQIKSDFLDIYERELQISDNSLIIEIWGHLYYEYYILQMKHFLPGRNLKAWVKNRTKPSAVVDCGEKGQDNNRFLWDLLAAFKPVFSRLIPKNIYASRVAVYKH